MAGLAVFICTACSHDAGYYVARGDKFFSSGKYDDAALNYRNAIARNPKAAEAYFRLGLSEFKQNHFQESWRYLNRAADLAPARDDIGVAIGNICLVGVISDPQKAIFYDRLKQISDALVAKNANSFDGWRFRGYLALFDRKLDEAIACFRRANGLAPGEPDVAISLVQALFQKRQDNEAVLAAQSFIKLKPAHGPAYDALFSHYMSLGQNSDAEQILKLKISNNPGEPVYVTQLCGLYWGLGKKTEALELVKNLLARPSPTAAVHLAAGDFYGSIEQWESAALQFNEGARLQPEQKPLFQKRMVNLLLAQGKVQEATRVVEEILRASPHDNEALRIRAGLGIQGRQPSAIASAIGTYRQLLSENDLDPTLHYDLGKALIAAKDVQAASAEFKTAIRLQPKYVASMNELAELALGQRQPEEALVWSNQALDIEPQNGLARLLKARSLRASGKLQLARAELNEILRQSPSDTKALLQLGLVEVERKDFKAAEAAFRQLEGLDPISATSGMSTMFVAQGQVNKAFEVLKQLVRGHPDGAVAHDMLATLAVRQGEYDLAAGEFRSLLALDPNSSLIHMRLAEVYKFQGNLSQCIAELEQAQKLEPQNVTAKVLLAAALASDGQTENAIRLYRQALLMQPEDPGIQNNLAFLLVETNGNLDEALRLAQSATRKSPTQANFTDTLGWIYIRKGMPSDALRLFETLVNRDPEEPTYRYHLGVALLKTGNVASARLALETALAKKPSKAEAQKIRELLAGIG